MPVLRWQTHRINTISIDIFCFELLGFQCLESKAIFRLQTQVSYYQLLHKSFSHQLHSNVIQSSNAFFLSSYFEVVYFGSQSAHSKLHRILALS